MLEVRKLRVKLFVDRSTGRWVVLDQEGNFWFVPCIENSWDHRESFQPTDETELEPVPGHYKNMLGLPF